MITEALQHSIGVGPARLAQLHDAGVRSWEDVLHFPDRIPECLRRELVTECRRCLAALDSGDVRYFVDRLNPRDKWRVLAHFFEQASFFDIETVGLEHGAPITVIVCWHKGRLWSFVEHENLDDFLSLLDDVTLLTSFNGSSFDVPRVLDAFHIPELPCAHLDLRWVCYHQKMTGGLKEIASRSGILRPSDLQDTDGEYAARLWEEWTNRNDPTARGRLIRYCAADVLLLLLLGQRLIGRSDASPDHVWAHLPSAQVASPGADSMNTVPTVSDDFGRGSPTRLRGRRVRRVDCDMGALD